MIVRHVKEEQYARVEEHLKTNVAPNHMSVSYDVVMAVDSRRFQLRLQLERSRKVAILQAVMTDGVGRYEIVTRGSLLSALLELYLLPFSKGFAAGPMNR